MKRFEKIGVTGFFCGMTVILCGMAYHVVDTVLVRGWRSYDWLGVVVVLLVPVAAYCFVRALIDMWRLP